MTAPAPVQYPLGPPVVSNVTVLTVDMALNQPNRITRRIADLALQRFIVSRIFSTGGTAVNGGAIMYEQALVNELYTDRDVERVAPGGEFPIVGASRRGPKVAEVEKYGGKFQTTDEARKRNDTVWFNNQVTMLSNTIVKKVNTRAVAELDAAIAALGGAGTFTGNDWSAVITNGSSATNNADMPAADFAEAQMLAEQDELGVAYDLWIVNPQEMAALVVIYGEKLPGVLAAAGIKEVFPSNRVTAGTAYAVARGQVGFLEYEQGLGTETWRDPETESWWTQSSVRPVMGITNPMSIRKVTGLAG
jgi:hypothetical protein